MERRNKRKNLACKCNIEVSFLVCVFLFFHGFLFGYKTQQVLRIFCMSKLPFSWASCSSLEPFSTSSCCLEQRGVICRRFLSFSGLTRWLALAKKHTHEECKECHEVNVMASQWNCGGGSVLWAEPGPWALPSSLSVCLSCHDGHLSCPQSVWEEFFFFSLLREEGREGGR